MSSISAFYTAFAAADHPKMASLYAENVIFSDPAFGTLHGPEVPAMWKMLLERSKGNLKITFKDVVENKTSGSATWIAEYEFSQTKRKVINVIHAEFTFDEFGKIKTHIDSFDLWKWSRQALGLKGLLLGWSGFFRKKLHEQTRRQLKKFMQLK